MTELPLHLFLKSIWRHWWALMSCAAFTFLGIWDAYANERREWVLWSSFLLGIVFLLIAAYRTWLAEHRQLFTTSQTADAVICSLKEELARKHPYDEQAEAAVRKAISRLGDAEVQFLAWLLKVDRPRQGQVQGQGFRGEPASILQKTSTLLIGFADLPRKWNRGGGPSISHQPKERTKHQGRSLSVAKAMTAVPLRFRNGSGQGSGMP